MARTLSLAEIFQLGYYWESKVLLTAVKLDIFEALAGECGLKTSLSEGFEAAQGFVAGIGEGR